MFEKEVLLTSMSLLKHFQDRLRGDNDCYCNFTMSSTQSETDTAMAVVVVRL